MLNVVGTYAYNEAELRYLGGIMPKNYFNYREIREKESDTELAQLDSSAQEARVKQAMMEDYFGLGFGASWDKAESLTEGK
ncbi:hypothetical protein HanXRQr2_Chr10g0455371 [Helianthus annuus]|uniref:Uncharacterized protein n=1 Tax=Helianthus annuus TaxID=4232 RepID=A0A9K3HZV5_HELAN|nr:hypothetical protein HanXRQr2_Chr10g0455371 [Helianthus annuus]KAJ0884955.1 hypothetical protein HanPSC8_Chr10g0439811 [Helianthus annuus]